MNISMVFEFRYVVCQMKPSIHTCNLLNRINWYSYWISTFCDLNMSFFIAIKSIDAREGIDTLEPNNAVSLPKSFLNGPIILIPNNKSESLKRHANLQTHKHTWLPTTVVLLFWNQLHKRLLTMQVVNSTLLRDLTQFFFVACDIVSWLFLLPVNKNTFDSNTILSVMILLWYAKDSLVWQLITIIRKRCREWQVCECGINCVKLKWLGFFRVTLFKANFNR